MRVLIAEKPSVARDLARFVKAAAARDGYFEGNGWQVTWAFGHLVTLQEPHEYRPELRRWSLEALPFIPEAFKLKLVDAKGVKQQFAVIKRLFKEAEEIVCATDAGREGELIFRYILSLSGQERKPFRRLWLSSLTPEAIAEAFRALRPGRDYDNLYAAARCRSEADWVVGLNATRCFTVRYGGRGILWSIGRVQTPVLALIAARDDEIRLFEPKPFWELVTRYRDVAFKFRGERFPKREEAQALLDQVLGRPFRVTAVGREARTEKPPQLFDLTGLQREMNRLHGLSAAETLQHAQTLYEQKFLTYPRTDSCYLGSDMKSRVPGILEKLRAVRAEAVAALDLAALPFTPRIVNDKLVSDHHAVIPTGNIPSGLAPAAQKVFDAVVTRFIAAFYPPCEKEITTVDGESNGVPFRAQGTRIVKPGWMALYPNLMKQAAQNRAARGEADKDRPDDESEGKQGTEEAPQLLPAFRQGESGPHEPALKEGQTKPPPYYTENSLLAAMESAGRFVDDEQLRHALKERGLGTPATRAQIIETLLARSYIRRDRRKLAVTDLGRYLIGLVRERSLKSPELTGEWEGKLKQIERGAVEAGTFMAGIAEFTRGIVRSVTDDDVDRDRWGACPRCGKEVIEGKRGYGCSGWKQGCPFVLWKEYKGLPLQPRQAQELIQRRMLASPVSLPAAGPVILCLTDAGKVLAIAEPSGEAQRKAPKVKAGGRGGPRRRPSARRRRAGTASS